MAYCAASAEKFSPYSEVNWSYRPSLDMCIRRAWLPALFGADLYSWGIEELESDEGSSESEGLGVEGDGVGSLVAVSPNAPAEDGLVEASAPDEELSASGDPVSVGSGIASDDG